MNNETNKYFQTIYTVYKEVDRLGKNQTLLKNIVEDIVEQFKSLNDCIKENQTEIFTPKKGETYWFIFNDGSYDNAEWENDDNDNHMLEIGNVYSSEQKVKDKIKELKRIQVKGKPKKEESKDQEEKPKDQEEKPKDQEESKDQKESKEEFIKACPKCKKEINRLDYQHTKYENGTYDGAEYTSDKPNECKEEELEYSCPICNEILFTDEEDVDVFLNN